MLDFTRLMLISTQVEVVVEVGVELGNMENGEIRKNMNMGDNYRENLKIRNKANRGNHGN